MKEPTWQEIQGIIRKAAKASAAPGPSGISDKVWKKCPKPLQKLRKIIRKIWAKDRIPSSWELAEGCFIPKEEAFSTIHCVNVMSSQTQESLIKQTESSLMFVVTPISARINNVYFHHTVFGGSVNSSTNSMI